METIAVYVCLDVYSASYYGHKDYNIILKVI